MNVWLKTANNRRNNLMRSFATSDNSLKSPLPVIIQTQRNEEILSDSNFSIDEGQSDVESTDFQFLGEGKFPNEKEELRRSLNQRNSVFTDYFEQNKKGPVSSRNQVSSSESSLAKVFKFSSTSSSEQILTKRSLQQENLPKIQRTYRNSIDSLPERVSHQRITDSVRVLPSQRVSRGSGILTNSKRLLTTGRKNDLREHVVSVIQYCSNQVGIACYNVNTGQIKLAQIIERMTYFRTIATIQRYYPQEIVYSTTLENTPLIKNLMETFKRTSFRPIKRNMFDETKGYYIYTMRGNQDERNPDNKFLSFAALHALVNFLENSFEITFNYNALNIKWHFLEELLIIHSQTIMDLEIFINQETKSPTNTFIDNFRCLTDGGMRMLRANLLQPLTDLKQIKTRQDLTETLIQNKPLHDLLMRELVKFRHYEPITAKFIQNPKKQSIKSIKSYLGAILNLSRMCFELQAFKNRLTVFEGNSSIIDTVLTKFGDQKLNNIRRTIKQNFDEEVLKNFEGQKTKNRKENFIFLFKVQKIEDQFAEISRLTYSHTIEDILRIFTEIKQKSNQSMKLLHNDFRGYYISAKSDIDLRKLSETIEDDIVHITHRGNVTTFSTSILVSMNNRLKQNQNKLIYQSESLLLKIIKQIQGCLAILFEVNYWMSMMDMVLGFSAFVKLYRTNFKVQFCRPSLSRNCGRILLDTMRTVWTMEKFNKISEGITLEIEQSTNALVIHKEVNSYQQLNILYSIGFMSILGQVGCLVPARKYQGILFDTLISKMQIEDSLENKMSHFQIQLSSLRNILENSGSGLSSRCLILIDQLVKGTQPQQQWALSLSAIQQLRKIQGKSIVLVSDKTLLKFVEQIEGVSICEYSSSSGTTIDKKQQQLKQCFRDYNFCPYFMELYEKIGRI